MRKFICSPFFTPKRKTFSSEEKKVFLRTVAKKPVHTS